eukprot:585078-Rhodomonas_salina.1
MSMPQYKTLTYEVNVYRIFHPFYYFENFVVGTENVTRNSFIFRYGYYHRKLKDCSGTSKIPDPGTR